MRYHPIHLAGAALLLGACLSLTGCARAPSEAPVVEPPPVTVSYPVEREVSDHADFTARTAAVDSVELRARVSGYLDKVNFKEGALVNKGDLLFEIDPRTYQATLKVAEGNLATMEARVERLTADLVRARRMIASRAIGREQFDKIAGDRSEAGAQRAAQKASVERARLDVGFTRVTAPISGRISRYQVTVGNLVQAGDLTGGTLLTTIVSVDPMYAYFDVDERTVLRVRQLVREVVGTGGDWRSVIDGLRPHTERLWQAMPAAERSRFLSQLRPFWEVHRHRMALAISERFERLRAEGMVRLVPAVSSRRWQGTTGFDSCSANGGPIRRSKRKRPGWSTVPGRCHRTVWSPTR